ncbi:MAG TPA: FAD:protein FMN transferase [Luteolibacter sp.]|nr:FAD:protein FMN transferase [Luteolibacter sp.]
MKRAAILLGFLALLGFLFWKRSPRTTELHGSAMGVRWTLEWHGQSPPPADLKSEVSATLEHWEQVLSQWRPTSDLSRHNHGEAATPELARVIMLADEIRSATGGAFDHHILGKVHAAGFGPEGEGIDLSSIGKGFAVDRVCERLGSLGMNDFIFALAGEVRAEGEWPVDIEKPLPAASVSKHTIRLGNRSIATSGNYRQFRETNDGIVSHIIDPRTGKPVIRPFSSVTVVAKDCATASAWATALFVLGPDHPNRPPGAEVIWQMETTPQR